MHVSLEGQGDPSSDPGRGFGDDCRESNANLVELEGEMTGELGDNSRDSAKRERIESARLREYTAAGVSADRVASKEETERSGDATLEFNNAGEEIGVESGIAGEELIESAEGGEVSRVESTSGSSCIED